MGDAQEHIIAMTAATLPGKKIDERANAPLSVSAFLAKLNDLLATQAVWVEGEVTDARISQNRFLWFSLKDEKEEAVVSCFALTFRVRVPIEDGMKVRVWGVPKVHPRSGKFSIQVEMVELAGEGALRRAFEILKQRLEREGLFAIERKRALPRFPERIGLITSPDAAAYSDFLKVLQARRGGIEVFFVPVSVQGRAAPDEIIQALEYMNEEYGMLDALVLVRGGGSLEDLHAFNDERVVRAIARSRLPTIVGIGHERDITLADLVADVRGSTPSNAAELLTPTREEIRALIAEHVSTMRTAFSYDLREKERNVAHAVNVLRDTVQFSLDRFTALTQRATTVSRILYLTIHDRHARIREATVSLIHLLRVKVTSSDDRIASLRRTLLSLHPHRVLARGYSITHDAAGHVLRNAQALRSGDLLQTTLHRGTLTSRFETSSWQPNPPSTSAKRTKNSKRSSPNSRQATLI